MPRLRPPRTPKQATIWPSVVVSATAMPLLTGCVTASGDAAAPLRPNFVAAAVGLVMVWVFMVKATAAVMVALVKIRQALFELAAVVVSFLGAAAITGAGLALVTWVTLS
ncbi:hypothetical protein [Virgisporangium aurantiacum]|nr:hypothetical protein [Virgisporangium aurantiacum]